MGFNSTFKRLRELKVDKNKKKLPWLPEIWFRH
jgi:hypothetical protein